MLSPLWNGLDIAGHLLTGGTAAAGGIVAAHHIRRLLRPRQNRQSIKDLCGHRRVMGAWRSGKSTLLLHMIRDSIARGWSVIILDPHGPLVEDTLLSIELDRTAYDLVLCAPGLGYSAGINPFRRYSGSDNERDFVVESAMSFIRSFTTNWGHVVEQELLQAIGETVDTIENPTLQDVMDRSENPKVRLRLQKLLGSRVLSSLLCKTESIDFTRVMNRPTVFLMSMDRLAPFTKDLLYKVAMTQIMMAAFTRHRESPVCTLFCDEVQRAVGSADALDTLLEECGKYRVPVTYAHHSSAQFPPDMARKAWLTGSHYLFRLEASDARQAETVFASDVEAEQLMRLPNYYCYERELVGGCPRNPRKVKTKPPPTPIRKSIRDIVAAPSKTQLPPKCPERPEVAPKTAGDGGILL